MNHGTNMVLGLDSIQQDFIVHSSSLSSSKKAKPTLLYLGDRNLRYIKEFESKGYTLLQTLKAKTLHALMRDWSVDRDGMPFAIIVDDQFLPTLLLEDLKGVRKKTPFVGVPVFAFAKKKDKIALSAINSLQIDDYEPYPVRPDQLLAKVDVYHTLKKAGISTWGISPEREFNLDEKNAIWAYKRAFDITIASIGLLLASPLLLLAMIAIRLESKGPIFYFSKRAGRNYKVFKFYKLRSMYPDAEARLAELKEKQNQYKDGNQFVKIKDDPRITKVGGFIRSTSIDEIPQLFNVIKGDMSIVGNRPLPLYEAEQLTVDDHAERFLAPAGITGLWQVLKRGKGEMSSEERILLDRIYVRKNSFFFDIKLIFMTIPAILQKEDV
ncbi:MAG: sugar transferase [Bacteroidota bacterium]